MHGAIQTSVDLVKAMQDLHKHRVINTVGTIISPAVGAGAVAGLTKLRAAMAASKASAARIAALSAGRRPFMIRKAYPRAPRKPFIPGGAETRSGGWIFAKEVAKKAGDAAALEGVGTGVKGAAGQTAGDLIKDSLKGGDDTYEGLMEQARAADDLFNKHSSDYNALRDIYKRCCSSVSNL